MSTVIIERDAQTWSAAIIANAISRQILQRKCLVLCDNTYWTGYECDLLGVCLDRRLIDIEIKISRSDLKADAGKDKWWHHQPWWHQGDRPKPVARVWPPKIWKHYYALPFDVWKPELAAVLPSEKSGVLTFKRMKDSQMVTIRCERRCQPNRDAEPISETDCLDIARLQNLRMWEAYEARDKALMEARSLRAAA